MNFGKTWRGLLWPRPFDRMEIQLPLIAAGFMLLSAIGTAQFATYWLARELDRQAALVGAVYLDNLSANVAPKLARNDIPAVTLALERTLSYYEGIRDESLFLIGRDGKLLAQAQRDGAPGFADIPPTLFHLPHGTIESPAEFIAWVWRPLKQDNEITGTLVAALNVQPLYAGRRLLSLYILLAGFAVSALAAVAGMWFIRRQLRPITKVTAHLESVAAGRFEKIAEAGRRGDLVETLRSSFNQMVSAMRERESMAQRLADENRSAVLGRLTATIVHEVKNPLGGMKTAVETIKKYGDDGSVRREAAGLIERGLETVEHVIDATLDSYKLPTKSRMLTADDIADVSTLIEAEARQRGITFKTDVQTPAKIAVHAVETRQVLLNLLLNACRATPRLGTVTLSGKVANGEVQFRVSDSGPGLDLKLARSLQQSEPLDGEGLGLPIVRRLVDRMNGSITAFPAAPRGTLLLVRLPLIAEEAVA